MIWRFTFNSTALGSAEVDEPIGWDDIILTMRRDKVLHGMVFEYGDQLRFPEEGYRYIKQLYQTYGVEAKATMAVDWQCDECEDFEELDVFDLNFTRLNFDEGEQCTANIGVEQANCQMQFMKRMDQKVNLDTAVSFNGTTALTPYSNLGRVINIPSKTIFKEDNYRNDINLFADWNNPILSNTISLFTLWKLGFGNIVFNEFGALDSSMIMAAFNNTPFSTPFSIWQNCPPLIIIDEDGDYSVDFNIALDYFIGVTTPSLGSGVENYRFTVQFVIVDIDGNTKVNASLYDSGAIASSGSGFPDKSSCSPPDSVQSGVGLLSYSNTHSLVKGDTVLLVAQLGFDATAGLTHLDCERVQMTTQLIGNFFRMTLLSSAEPTTAKLYLVNEALSRATEAITDDCLRVYSDYLGRTDAQPYASGADGCGALEAITSGLLLRQFPDKPLTVSFKELYNGLSAIHNLGLGIEPDPNRAGQRLIRVEPMEYFYTNTVRLQLDNIANIRRTVTMEEHYSKVVIGYNKWEAEEFNGLDESNTKREYRTNLTLTQNTLEKLSNLVASGYAIEITRRKPFSDSSTKDWRYDNETFVICLVRDGGNLEVEQGNISSAANLIDPATVTNFRLSPARNALRWMKVWIRSYIDPTNGTISKALFTNGEGNVEASGAINNGCEEENTPIAENGNLDINKLLDNTEGMPVFVPEEFSLKYPLSKADWKLIKANPNDIIQIRWGQNVDWLDCYLRELKYDPNEGSANFILIPKLIWDFTHVLEQSGGYSLREDGGKELREQLTMGT